MAGGGGGAGGARLQQSTGGINSVTGRALALQGSAAPRTWATPFQVLVAPERQQLNVGTQSAGRDKERERQSKAGSRQILWISGAERGALAASSDIPILVLPLTPSLHNIPGREDTKQAPWLQERLI